jgi:uncharacterized protein YodC (DUF2158 family)
MEKQDFGPGSVVRLKSGGPAMVIDRALASGEWSCHWMHDDGKHHTASFPELSLVPARPDPWPRPPYVADFGT